MKNCVENRNKCYEVFFQIYQSGKFDTESAKKLVVSVIGGNEWNFEEHGRGTVKDPQIALLAAYKTDRNLFRIVKKLDRYWQERITDMIVTQAPFWNLYDNWE